MFINLYQDDCSCLLNDLFTYDPLLVLILIANHYHSIIFGSLSDHGYSLRVSSMAFVPKQKCRGI